MIVDSHSKEVIQAWQQGATEGYPLLEGGSMGPTPIKRVRKAEANTWHTIHNLAKTPGAGQYVAYDNNYMAVIYKDKQGKWTGWHKEKIITFFEAVQRKKAGYSIIPPHEKGYEVHFTLRQYDYLLLDLEQSTLEAINWEHPSVEHARLIHSNLYRLQALSSSQYVFDLHSNVNEIKRYALSRKEMYRRNAVKVWLDPLGAIYRHQFLCH